MTQTPAELLKELLVSEFKADPDAINPAASFQDLGLDSLDVVSMVMALEDRLGVEIPERELEGVRTFGHAVELLEKKVAASA